jgi:hypothetical protein
MLRHSHIGGALESACLHKPASKLSRWPNRRIKDRQDDPKQFKRFPDADETKECAWLGSEVKRRHSFARKRNFPE